MVEAIGSWAEAVLAENLLDLRRNERYQRAARQKVPESAKSHHPIHHGDGHTIPNLPAENSLSAGSSKDTCLFIST